MPPPPMTLQELNNLGSVHLEVIKKSKFFVKVSQAQSFEDAMVFLEKASEHNARHNCWAYRSLTGERYSDDGEPSGTAGKPILGILEAENMINTVVVVSRYFGGIKLGAGGLIRAYASSAKNALLVLEKKTFTEVEVVEIVAPMNDIGPIYQILQQFQTSCECYQKLSEEYVIQSPDSNSSAPPIAGSASAFDDFCSGLNFEKSAAAEKDPIEDDEDYSSICITIQIASSEVDLLAVFVILNSKRLSIL
jgi:uncharacterized YigZ family protein